MQGQNGLWRPADDRGGMSGEYELCRGDEEGRNRCSVRAHARCTLSVFVSSAPTTHVDFPPSVSSFLISSHPPSTRGFRNSSSHQPPFDGSLAVGSARPYDLGTAARPLTQYGLSRPIPPAAFLPSPAETHETALPGGGAQSAQALIGGLAAACDHFAKALQQGKECANETDESWTGSGRNVIHPTPAPRSYSCASATSQCSRLRTRTARFLGGGPATLGGREEGGGRRSGGLPISLHGRCVMVKRVGGRGRARVVV